MLYGLAGRPQIQVQPLKSPGQCLADEKITVVDIVSSRPLKCGIDQPQHDLRVSGIGSGYSYLTRSAVYDLECQTAIAIMVLVAL